MPRSVKEWHGRTDDTPVPPRVRLRVFIRYGRRCDGEGCGLSLEGKRWTCDHRLALILGGENRESNLHPLGNDCCNPKKNAADAAMKSQTYESRKRDAGIKAPSSFACARTGRFKQKLPTRRHPFGQVVRRQA